MRRAPFLSESFTLAARVGRASAAKLRALGCRSVADVAALDPRPVRKGMTVVGERLIYELRGIACVDLEEVAPTRKGCAVTRSFSSRVRDLDRLEKAVATYAARLGEKLRQQNLGTDHLVVFRTTRPALPICQFSGDEDRG